MVNPEKSLLYRIVMFKVPAQTISFTALVICLAFAGSASAQKTSSETKPVNFGYSQNPKTRTKPPVPQQRPALDNTGTQRSAADTQPTTAPPPSIAAKTLEIAKRASAASIAPTEVYKVGTGDVLFINLQNAGKASSYYTVLNDGTIDYPLAGTMIFVSGHTVEEIEDLLSEKIKLYENPRVSVKVREYGSHAINVLGMVESSGAKNIQREAIPLFVVKAEAMVQPKATHAIIRRANSQTETLVLKDPRSDNVLVFPGDIVEFASSARGGDGDSAFYFIGGEVASIGQKEFHDGITLSQAIMASGGTSRAGIKKVVIRRKNNEGFLMPIEFSLKSIKEGKQADPVLQAGDTIEVGN
jgi:protein involved in polysaccharide export with SLBB domain